MPVARGALQPIVNAERLALQTFGGQCRHPFRHHLRRHLRYDAVARRIMLFGEEFLIVVPDMLRHGNFHLRRAVAIFGSDGTVLPLHDVQNHIVVGRVGVMVVAIPVRGKRVNLNVSHPVFAVDAHLSVEEVRPRLKVVRPGLADATEAVFAAVYLDGGIVAASALIHRLLLDAEREEAVLPDVVEEFFHDFVRWWQGIRRARSLRSLPRFVAGSRLFVLHGKFSLYGRCLPPRAKERHWRWAA